jgi:hypothetical protein
MGKGQGVEEMREVVEMGNGGRRGVSLGRAEGGIASLS